MLKFIILDHQKQNYFRFDARKKNKSRQYTKTHYPFINVYIFFNRRSGDTAHIIMVNDSSVYCLKAYATLILMY